VAQTGEPVQLRLSDEGEEPRALHADQRVGGPLQDKDRAGDALQPLGRSSIAAWTVASYPGASAKSTSS